MHYLALAESDRKKKAKDTAAVKKVEKATKADQKYSHGYSVLDKSEAGVKRKRSIDADDDTDNDSDDVVMSAAYRRENKVPEVLPSETSSSSSSSSIPSSTFSKKRKASPPKQSRILSQEEMREMYPNLCLNDEEPQDETSPEKKVCRRTLRALRLLCLSTI